MPHPESRSLAVTPSSSVGYDDKNQQFIVRNSWAATWGQKGYFRMPYAYLTSTSLASDLWTIRSVK